MKKILSLLLGSIVALTLTISGMSISTLTDALFGSTFTGFGNTSSITMVSLLVVLATAAGAVWLVHGDQIKALQKKKKKKKNKSKKKKKNKSKKKK